MPIEAKPGCIVATGYGVEIVRLVAAKGAIRLESLGMQHSSGRSIRKLFALELGLGARAKADAVLARIEERIAELRALDAYETQEPPR